MTLWQYTALLHEHEYRNSDRSKAMSDKDMDDMLDWIRGMNLPDVRI